jgi:3'-phosphoadenosine 5'-phosphosulfate sulfotransferase (PAPS reductase)/FAD synthetase
MLSYEAERAIAPADRPHVFAENRVHYIDSDVLTEAKKRIRHCLTIYDRCAVSYSGGKDSLVVLHLVREVMDEMGWTQPLDVVFRDEELIPQEVIDFVLKLNDEPEKWRLHYFAVPMKSHYFIMGKHLPYVQWDVNRKHLREPPSCAIRQLHPENLPLDQHEMQALTNLKLGWKGKIGVFNGIRAQESLMRFRASNVIKNTYNYIAGDSGGAKDSDFIKVIYDWSERDVFRYFYDRGISYCRIYEQELFAGAPLRVSTPLHDKAYNYLKRLRVMYPKFFEQIIDVFPEVATHERYWKDVDRFAVISRYPKSFEGIIRYIEDEIDDPVNRERAIKAVKTAWISKNNNKRRGKYSDKGACFGYPILHVFQKVVSGDWQKGIQVHSNPDQSMIDYERQAEAEAAARAGCN